MIEIAHCGVSGSPHVAEIHVHERVACISQVFVHKYIYVQHDLARFWMGDV